MAKRTKKETTEKLESIVQDGKVTLLHPSNKDEFSFSPDHALNVMSMENNGGWEFKVKGATVEKLREEIGVNVLSVEVGPEEDCGCGKK